MTGPQPAQGGTDAAELESRRRAQRFESNVPLRIVIEAQDLAGKADNLSEDGVFLFASEKVRVRVQVDEDGEVKSYAGRIVRLQQMSPEETGFAIEFDRASN